MLFRQFGDLFFTFEGKLSRRFVYKTVTNKLVYYLVLWTFRLRSLIRMLTRFVLRISRKKVLVVFGMSRSGTSMLGTLLAQSRSSVYLHEPEVELLKYHYKRMGAISSEKFWDFTHRQVDKDFETHMMTFIVLGSLLSAGFRFGTICIKPISFLNIMQEVSETLPDLQILYISRHPAGRIDSVLRQWKRHENVEHVSLEKIERLGQDWGKTTCEIQEMFKTHPQWNWIIFEDLANDPLVEFKKLYEKYHLKWDHEVQAAIVARTTERDGRFYEVQRDSSKQADKWRTALSEEQVEAIRRGCQPFNTDLYESF
jgi:hypothetical protein